MRDCHCRTCAGEHPEGWRIEDVAPAGDRSGFSFTMGLWHGFGSPEVAIFGLDPPARRRYLTCIGEAAAEGRFVVPDQFEDDILGDLVVVPRPVLAGWHRHVFPAVLDFYRGQPVPVVQLVWPDARGAYPWDRGSDTACVEAQPRLWDRVAGQRRWATAPDPEGWAFPVPPDTPVAASLAVAFGSAPATAVIHDDDGEWEFLAEGDDGADLTLVGLVHLACRQRDLATLADLPPGWEAERIAPGAWLRHPLDEDE